MSNAFISALAGGSIGPTPTGDAVVADVLAGKTFSNAQAIGLEGTMTNNGAVSQTLTPGQSYTIPAGYHNGLGTVTASGSPDIMPANTYSYIGYQAAETEINQGPIVAGTAIHTPTTYAATLFHCKNFSLMTLDAPAAVGSDRIAFHSDVTVTKIAGGNSIDLTNIDYIMIYTQGQRTVTFT